MVAVTGCGLLVDVGGLSGGEQTTADSGTAFGEGGASPDDAGTSTPDGASALDGGDAGSSFCQPKDLFCDTFDEGRFDPRWTTVPAGAELVMDKTSSSPYAAKLAPLVNVNMFLRLVLTPPNGAPTFSGTLEIQFDWSTSEIGFLLGQVTLDRAGGTGNMQVYPSVNDIKMGLNFDGSNALTTKRRGTTFERVVVSATLSADGAAKPVGLNDTPTAPNTLPAVIPEPSKLTLDIGFVAPPGRSGAVVYVDNVRVSRRAP
jgi:hypothetical protein